VNIFGDSLPITGVDATVVQPERVVIRWRDFQSDAHRLRTPGESLELNCNLPICKDRGEPMTMALWRMDCQQPVGLDLHGNCELCGNPDVRVIDRLNLLRFLKKVLQMNKSPWLLATAILLGVGLTIWVTRQTK
jgi:hypothetical protein